MKKNLNTIILILLAFFVFCPNFVSANPITFSDSDVTIIFEKTSSRINTNEPCFGMLIKPKSSLNVDETLQKLKSWDSNENNLTKNGFSACKQNICIFNREQIANCGDKTGCRVAIFFPNLNKYFISSGGTIGITPHHYELYISKNGETLLDITGLGLYIKNTKKPDSLLKKLTNFLLSPKLVQGLIFALLTELAIAILMIRHEIKKYLSVLYAVILANLISFPVFFYGLNYKFTDEFHRNIYIIGSEILVIIFEFLIIYLFNRKKINAIKAFKISLAMNLFSIIASLIIRIIQEEIV